MLKLSRNLLDSMDRFVLDRNAPARGKYGSPREKRGAPQYERQDEPEYAEYSRT
jgi:hypothetical protein